MSESPRGTVAFLFTDIEGSTQLWERNRAAMRLAVARHDALLDEVIAARGGVLYKRVGDAVQAAFDTASEALAAAVDAQQALAAESWPETGPLPTRIALHIGEAVPDASGDYHQIASLNRLSRLLAVGHGGQILLTEAVRRLLEGRLPAETNLKDLGEHRLRDLLEPERVWQVVLSNLPADFPPLRSLERHLTNLPIQLTPLVGRDADVAAIKALFARDDVRLVALTGPGGSGKTRLALAVAAELLDAFPDGVWFVDLASLTDPALVLPTLAATLGISEAGAQPLRDTLAANLADQRVLLVLDNFEHLLEAAPVLSTVLQIGPDLALLVTSREPLRLRGEREVAVAPLAVPDLDRLPPLADLAQNPAVSLFVQRAQAVKADFTLSDDNIAAIARICRRLDGLPLAIELAAARVKLLPPQTLVTRLERSLPLLTGGARDAPARQRALRNTIAWSYELLEADEQRLFRQLGVFAGGFTLDAAAAVADAGPSLGDAVLDGLSSLVDKSLVVPLAASSEGMDLGDSGELRFVMLETIREFAQGELARSGEEASVRSLHADYFRILAERAEPELRGSGQVIWIARLERELPNLRTVLDWSLACGDAETGLRLAGALYWFWFLRNHVSEGRTWFERARAVTNYPAGAAGKAALGAALLALRAQEYAASKILGEQALERFQAAEDRWGTAMVVHHLGHMADDLDHDMNQAAALLEESLQQFQALGDPWGIAYSQRCLAQAQLAATHDYDRATILLQSALTTFRAIGDPWNTGVTLHVLGDAAREYERWKEAIAAYQESLSYHWTERDVLGVADALLRLAQILVAVGNMDLAVRLFGCAEAHHEQAGVTLYEPIRRGYEQAIASARAALGAERFDGLWNTGRAMPLAEAADAVATIRIDPPESG